MDLMAYMQIGDLEEIAKNNGIEVPRLRGYRLMADEAPVSEEEIRRIMKEAEIDVCQELCRANPFWTPDAALSYSDYTDYLFGYYMVKAPKKPGEYHTEYTAIRWDRIHGKKRRILKFEIKKRKRKIQEHAAMWNKYAGKENILYIHARIGGDNWSWYGGDELEKKPWFLGKADDYFDNSYCDIYARIK